MARSWVYSTNYNFYRFPVCLKKIVVDLGLTQAQLVLLSSFVFLCVSLYADGGVGRRHRGVAQSWFYSTTYDLYRFHVSFTLFRCLTGLALLSLSVFEFLGVFVLILSGLFFFVGDGVDHLHLGVARSWFYTDELQPL